MTSVVGIVGPSVFIDFTASCIIVTKSPYFIVFDVVLLRNWEFW